MSRIPVSLVPQYVLPTSDEAIAKVREKLAAVRINPEENNSPTAGYDMIQRGVFGQTGMGPQERVNAALDEIPSGKGDVPVLPYPEALLPDHLGWTAAARRHGIVILIDDTNEFSGAITHPTRGYGLKKGSSNAGQVGYEADIDWAALAGIKGFATHTLIVSRYGTPASRMFGDNLNPSSEIYGAGGNVVMHLAYFYGEETLYHRHLNIAAGRMSYLSDFSSNPLYCNFMNNSFCGNPKAASDNYAHVSSPAANWALRIRVRPARTLYVQTGVYFPEKNVYAYWQNRSGFSFNGGTISGQSIPVEFGWLPRFGKNKLPGHYKVGLGLDTSQHESNYYDLNGRPRAITGADPHIYHNAWAAWVLADQMLIRHKTSDTAEGGLTLVTGAYFNQPRSATRAQLYEVGLVDTGFWPARPLDALGVNFAYHRVSSSVTRTQRLQQERGLPLMNGSYGPQRYGSVLETMYRIHVMQGVTFAPDFQYYFRPGAQKVLHNAAMLGFKSHVQFF